MKQPLRVSELPGIQMRAQAATRCCPSPGGRSPADLFTFHATVLGREFYAATGWKHSDLPCTHFTEGPETRTVKGVPTFPWTPTVSRALISCPSGVLVWREFCFIEKARVVSLRKPNNFNKKPSSQRKLVWWAGNGPTKEKTFYKYVIK